MGTSDELNWGVAWLSDNRKSKGGSLPSWTFALSDKNTTNYFIQIGVGASVDGGLLRSIHLLHLDQPRIPMYRGRPLGWGGGLVGS